MEDASNHEGWLAGHVFSRVDGNTNKEQAFPVESGLQCMLHSVNEAVQFHRGGGGAELVTVHLKLLGVECNKPPHVNHVCGG